jgi:hypothetical protein
MAQNAVAGAPGPGGPLYASPGFWIGTLTIAAISGFMAAVFADKKRTALSLGALAPALILGYQQGSPAPQGSSSSAAQHALLPTWLVQPALAEVPSPTTLHVAPSQGPDSVRFVRVVFSGGSEADLVAVVRSHAQALQLAAPATEEVRVHLTGPRSVVAIPRQTREVYAVLPNATTSRVSLTAGSDTVTLQLSVSEQRFMSGFARAFGVRSVAPVTATLRAQ